ncbi:MAG: flippase [bacterium]
MPRASSVIRNSAVLLAGTFVSKALVFVSYMVLTRELGAEEFGRFTYLFVFVAFFELIADAGIESIVLRDIERRPDRARDRFADAIALRALLIAAAIPVALLIFPWVRGDAGATTLLLLLACGTLFTTNRRASLRSLFELPYRTALRMEVPMILGILSEALCLALIVATVPRGGLAAAVASQILAPLPFAIVLAVLATRRLRPALHFDGARIAALFQSATPLIGALALNFILVRTDVFVLSHFRGVLDVGLYTASVRLVELSSLLPAIAMTSVFPLMARSHARDPARVEVLFRDSIRYVAAILVPVAVIEVLYADPLIALLFGAEFAASAPVLRVMAPAAILVAADTVMNARLIASGLERRNFQLILMATAANIAAMLFFVPTRGAPGAAIALLIAYGVRLAGGFLFADTRAAASQAIASLLPALGAGAAALSVHVTLTRAAALPYATIAAPIAALAAYAAALVYFGGLRRREA